jgi:RNA polymerase sigma-70 factor, ECF subfamily
VTSSDDGVSVFESVRPRLFGIAYRMVGSAAEAEDIVQDAWLRWQGTDRSAVANPPAFLATATMRLAITFAQSARSRRETYIGPWRPEPVDASVDPRLGAERAEALEFAVLLLLERDSLQQNAPRTFSEKRLTIPTIRLPTPLDRPKRMLDNLLVAHANISATGVASM